MRIAVMGSGGVGGYFGARLAKAGDDVVFIARGRHLEAIRENGLIVESALGDIRLGDAAVTDDPAGMGSADLVIFSVKLWDTEKAAMAIEPLIRKGAAVVSFQNGVQKDEILRAALGPEAVLGGVSYIAATIARPGVIAHTGTMQRLVFGEFDGSVSPRCEAFLASCQRAGIDAELSADIERAIWEKFVFLTGLSGTTATMHATIGEIREHPKARLFLRDVMREVVSVGRALGVALPEDFAETRLAFADGLPPEMTSSMAADRERGNPLEVGWLSGNVADLGEKVGASAPLNRAIADILALDAAGGRRV